MEAMSYVNIFETKGIEYLVVIAFLVSFFAFARLVLFAKKEELAKPDVVDGSLACGAGFECPYQTSLENDVPAAPGA